MQVAHISASVGIERCRTDGGYGSEWRNLVGRDYDEVRYQ